MAKYIFCDIDGPLLPGKMHLFPINKKINSRNLDEAQPMFDPFAVQCFNMWIKYSDAQIVFSTNWALNLKHNAETSLKTIMEHNGLKFEGRYHEDVLTPKRFTPHRGSEIWGWLSDNAKDSDTFIAVDDDHECNYIKDYIRGRDNDPPEKVKVQGKWIEVDFTNGMTWKNFVDGCKALDIDLDDINEQEFDIPKLTPEEKQKQKEALDMLIHCMC